MFAPATTSSEIALGHVGITLRTFIVVNDCCNGLVGAEHHEFRLRLGLVLTSMVVLRDRPGSKPFFDVRIRAYVDDSDCPKARIGV